MKKYPLLFATALLCGVQSWAADHEIKGKLTTDDGQPVSFGYIKVENSQYATQAGKDGTYSLNLPDGTYDITAYLMGYAKETKRVKVRRGQQVNFFLKEDLINLNSVTVTGTRTPKVLANTPVVTQIITADDIRKIDATNIRDVLTTELPGLEFSFAMDQQVSLTMQGLGGMSVLFLIDGERLAGETLDNTDFNRLNTSNIERIEIVKGAACALYGSNSVGAVINIITKKATEPWSLNLNTHFSSKNNQQRHGGSFGLNQGRFNNLLDVQTDGLNNYDVFDKDGTRTTVYGNRQWNFKDKLTYRINDNLNLIGRAGYYFHERKTRADKHDRARDFNGGLRLVGHLTEKDYIDVAYTYDRYDKSDYYTQTDKDFLNYKNQQNSVRILYTHSFDNLAWTSGGDGMIDYLKSYQFVSGKDHYQQYTADLFTQADWTINDHWNVVGGLRLDYFSKAGWNLTPKVAAMYKTGHFNFRGSYSGGFRAPTLKEMYMDFNMANIFSILGNPDLESEHSHSFALSAEYTRSRYSLTATGYYNILNNQITTLFDKGASDEVNTKGAMVYRNINGTNMAGADVTFTAKYPCGIGAKFSYSYFHEFPRNGQLVTSATRPHSFTTRIDYGKVLKNYEFDVVLTGRFLSWAKYNTISDTYDSYVPTTSAPYTLWNLTFTQRVCRAFRILLGVENLFNYKPKVYEFNSPYTTGTVFSAGLSIDVEQLFKKN